MSETKMEWGDVLGRGEYKASDIISAAESSGMSVAEWCQGIYERMHTPEEARPIDWAEVARLIEAEAESESID